MNKPIRLLGKTNDDAVLATLGALKHFIITELDERIREVRHRINNRWAEMPIDTLAQAKAAEAQRMHDIGLDDAFIRRTIANDLDCVVSTRAPKQRPGTKPTIRNWYDAKADTEWHFRDVADVRESEHSIWTISVTNASTNNPIRAYQRKKILSKKSA